MRIKLNDKHVVKLLATGSRLKNSAEFISLCKTLRNNNSLHERGAQLVIRALAINNWVVKNAIDAELIYEETILQHVFYSFANSDDAVTCVLRFKHYDEFR